MKKIITIICLAACSFGSQAQDFSQDMAKAKTAYQGGKLEEAHFALLQAMQELDLIIGKEVLNLLPTSMDSLASDPKMDNVTANAGLLGCTIHRTYKATTKSAEVNIIGHSPMISMLNTVLNTPMLGGMMTDQNSKIIRVQGYKGRLERRPGNMDGIFDYEMQIPVGSALFTLILTNGTDKEIMAMAEKIPFPQIAKLVN